MTVYDPGPTWGYAGLNWNLIHKCIKGKTICLPDGKRRNALKASLHNHDPNHPKTCPKCRALNEGGYDIEDMIRDDEIRASKKRKAIPEKKAIISTS
ncbi:MAG: hypothetical protein M0Q91_15640 [Methanoregula sp.]|jgi:hypothetical protein|nr:hypothetical protein [Methanoregula sp.]